jgi:dTDP-4-dehydrorhamnose 3,5-epimerase-like enzyme
MIQIPGEINEYFGEIDFLRYPIIEIPQKFYDFRGGIVNLADGTLGDVSLINSNKLTVRANHVHEIDWHLCFLISGSIRYSWRDLGEENEQKDIVVEASQMIFTPPKVPHRMLFLEESIFVTISKLSRISDRYELDTKRFDDGYFI